MIHHKTASKRSLHAAAVFFVLFNFISTCAFADIWYVRPGANGNGSSWANASGNLQAIINAANTGDEVWVAGGTYRPTNGADRVATFAMKAGVKIYGSFAGNESTLSQRTRAVRAANPTILSGDLGSNDAISGDALVAGGLVLGNNSDNSFHVVYNNNNGLTPANSLLDGFIISGGNANGAGANEGFGGGMFNLSSSPALRNIVFRWNNGNEGGGMLNIESSPRLENVVFYQNKATHGGGLLNESNALPNIFNAIFLGNYVTQTGGAVYNATSSSPNIINATFLGNYAGVSGAVLADDNSTTTLKNSIVWGNLNGGSSSATGSIIGGTTIANITYSIVQGGYSAGTNISSQDPSFLNAANPAGADGVFMTADDGLRPDFCNPAYNSGNNSGVSDIDILGNNRLFGTVDLGPYELQQPIVAATNWYLDADGDGYYAGTPIFTCSSPGVGYTAAAIPGGDCNNNNAAINPGATEVCNGMDDNCNGQVDEGTALVSSIIADGNLAVCNTVSNVNLSASWGNKALQLNGTNQYVITPNLKSLLPNKSFSIELWFKANSDGVIVSDLGDGGINSAWHVSQLELLPNGRLYARVWNLAAIDLGAVMLGTWNHAIIRYDEASNTFDGALNGGISGGKSFGDRQVTTAQHWAFGAAESTNLGSGNFFNGEIDEIRIWNKALSNTEIVENNKRSIAPNVAGLVAYYKLDHFNTNGNMALDATSNAGHASLNNNPQVTSPIGSLLNFPGYLWSNMANTPSITVNAVGIFTVQTTISGNCRATSASVQVGLTNVLYVDASKPAGGNGNSWNSAFNSLQDALAATNTYSCVNQIWVAKGTYKPTTGTDRFASFRMKDGIAIYGGFSGAETQLSQRDLSIEENASILSGDLNGDDDMVGSGRSLVLNNINDNSHNVINNAFTSANPLTPSAILDGFTITGGSNLSGNNPPYNQGAGMYNFEASPTLRNLVFVGNYGFSGGGGLANISNSSPVFSRVIFDRNAAQLSGGAIYNFNTNTNLTGVTFIGNYSTGNPSGTGGAVCQEGGTSQINNCLFEDNDARNGGAISLLNTTATIRASVFSRNYSVRNGGGIYADNSNLTVVNSVFAGQRAGWEGGAIYRTLGTLNISNSTLTKNESSVVGGNPTSFAQSGVLYESGTPTAISNSILWDNTNLFTGNPGIIRSIVQGGYSGTIVLDLDPQFLKIYDPIGSDGTWFTADDGLQLTSCSPGINGGENLGVTSTDILGNTRIVNSVVDFGAYEFQGLAQPLVPVAPTTTNNALRFDGSDQVALINSCGTGAPLVNGGDAITIEYWFQGSVLQSAVRLQPDGNNYIVSGHYGEHIMSNNGGGTPGSGVPVGAAATDGRWHHIAMTWERNRVNGFKSYLDGQIVGQRDAGNTTLPIINNGAYLGALYGNEQFLNGALEDVRIWNVVRTQAEIQAGICGSIPANEPGLVAWYAFDHGVANGNNLAITQGIENKAQPGYFSGQMNGFALEGTFSNFTNGPGKNLSRIYVKRNSDLPSPTGIYDGTSWETAFRELTDALNYTCTASNVEIWVAAGTYKPTLGTDRTASFKMRNGVAIYGGFAGTETELSQRNIAANVTILSGDLNGDDLPNNNTININDNSRHVFFINDFLSTEKLNSTAILDGFTITGGRATNPIDQDGFGGGFYLVDASPLLRNLIITGNFANQGGGGMFNGLSASPQLINVEFSNNSVFKDGAAMFNFTGANVVLNGVTIKNNSSFGSSVGGAITNFQNNYTLTNCHFSSNFSKIGGALGNLNAQGTISQSSFVNNKAIFWGGAVISSNSTLQISNSLFAGNNAELAGGVFYHNNSASVNVGNSTLYNNSVGRPGEFVQSANMASGVLLTEDGTASTFTNSIFWGNLSTFAGTLPTVTNSTVQGGYTGTGNISDYPRFFEPSNVLGPDGLAGTGDDGLRLKGCSPALNVGTNTGVAAQDILGNNRVFNSTVDMGAYELQETPSGTLITLFQDADGDGFGNPNVTLTDCGTLIGWVTNNNDCNDGQAGITTGPTSDPSTFGNNVWNVHAWNVGGATLSAGTAWNTNYAGFYPDNNLDVNTNNIWSANASPSAAPGYIGCIVNDANFSYSAKRKGFPEGEYRLSVPGIFEATELWINGTRVWSIEASGGTVPGLVWTGNLDQNSEVEYRVTSADVYVNSFLRLNFTRNTTTYVKTVATGTGDGSSWANATSNLQNAINTSNDFSQVWVAAGTYNLSTPLVMKNGVGIYGGFAATEDLISQRNLAANTSILTTNSTGSVILNNENGVGSSAVLDGFTISGGNAERGGGIANYGASPTIRNCIFRDNIGGTRGAATSDERNSAPLYINCVFTNNSSPAGIFWAYGLVTSQGSSPSFVNCTVSGNSGGNFFAFGLNSNYTFRNCIIWGNTSGFPWNSSNGSITMTNSLVEGGFGGAGNINQDPLFVSATDFRLQSCSPAIDAGSDVQNSLSTDIASLSRKRDLRAGGAQIDMGAFELQSEPLAPVSVSSTTTNNALQFDGIDDHVVLVNACGSGTPIVNGGDEITIEYWFKGSVLQSAVRLQPDGNTYIVSGHNGEHILSNDGGFSSGAGVPVGAAATDGNWHHVAMTWKRNTTNGFKSYLDGQLVGQRNSSDNPLPIVNSGAFLGALYGNLQLMTGALDDVRIWNVARTQEQIQSGLCSITLPQSGLVAMYTFDNGTANGDNTSVLPGVENVAQPGYYNGRLNSFALNGTASNWVSSPINNVWYADADNDGFGNPAVSQQACSQPAGYVTNNTDCDDNDALEKPGQTWYADVDNDGYSSGTSAVQCLRPTGYKTASELTATSGDCNDNVGGINPGVTEICDGIDNNCNGSTDEGGLTTYYADADNDGYGNPAVSQPACSQPSGYVTNNTDCDDNDALEKPDQTWYADTDNDGYSNGTTLTQCLRPTGYKTASELIATTGDTNDNDAAINPAATEICDGIDNNGNGSIDEGVTTTYYADTDGDGFGNPALSQQACSQPSGYVTNNTDCDDTDALEKPGQIWYADVDNDGYSNGTTLTQCLRPVGYKVASELTATSGDCNDSNFAIKPSATEICDGIDNNCNGSTDEGVTTTYYADADNDGFGNPAVSQQACSQPSVYVTNNTDCDDNDALEKPGQTWYADADNDGYSSGSTLTQCLRPSGYKVASELTATTEDCNDNNAAINPGATEICDGIDNNCNDSTDEGVTTTYYADADNDGFGNPAVSQQACSQPSGYVTNNTDCDDNDALEKPDQTWYADTDNDGYSNGTTLTQCLRPTGYKTASELIATTGDTNDNDAAINPAATEICDGIDNNGNGSIDEGVTTTYYADTDGDGFGNPAVSQQACSQPNGYVTNNTDCDDSDALEKPGQVWYADVDNDGYSNGTTTTQCLRPIGYKSASELTATSGDTNDNDAAINPGATEICDGIDNNSDGVTDEGCTPPMVSIHDPCTCMNNSPRVENGTTTNAGTFRETVTVEGPSGQTWTIVSVTGLYSDVNGTVAFTNGTTIPETGVGTGVFELSGYHRDGQGYSISVTNGRGNTLSIGNTCYYPDPVFTGLPVLVSPNAAPFTVTGTVANNADGTGTFILDGNTQVEASAAPTKLTINPATLSVGTHTLVYSFDAGTPGSQNPNDPGCEQVVRQRFQVANCGCQDVAVSLNENCQFLLTGNLVSDVNCGGGTVRVMDNNPSNGGLIDCAGVWTYGLFDAFGNIICWGKVTAEDKTAPELICPPANITLDCYDVNYVLNNRLTIGNVNATSSPRPASTSSQTINNAEGVDKGDDVGDPCDDELAPPSLVADNIKNLGYAYFKDNCVKCGCRVNLKWSDKVVFYSCEDMARNGGIYATISREWVATDCNGMRSDYTQKIHFYRPAIDLTAGANDRGLRFRGKGTTGANAEVPAPNYDWVVEYDACTPDKSLIKKADVTPSFCSYFNTSANPRCLYIDEIECNYSISIKDTEFPICGGKGVKIDRELYVFDWCAGGIVDTFHILIKIGDFEGPTATYAEHAPYEISTGPMDCTAAIPVTVAGIKSAFGVTIKDNCNLGNISAKVYTKDRYVKGILVYEGDKSPFCNNWVRNPQAELRNESIHGILGPDEHHQKEDICWEPVEYAVMNGMMIGLPVGKHLMVIDAFDGCYNSSSFYFVFEVKDKIAPIMKCDDDLHVTLSNANGYSNGYAQVSAADIDEGSWDNCKLAWIAVRRNVPDGCAASFIQKGYDTNGNGKLDALPADNDYSKADGFDRNGDGDIEDFGESFILKGGKLMTPMLDFVEFFCCDLTERVTVELWGGDIYGNTNYCWMDLLIEDKVAPTCLAPWDVTIYCDDKNIASIDSKVGSAAAFGDVLIPSGNDCAALDTVYTTEKKLKCGAGYIDRIWTLTKQTVKGPISVTCKQRIHILPVHEYNICFPKDVSTDCKTPIIDTVITDELGCDILAVNVHDKRYDASDDECYKIFRTYSVINWCTYDDRCGDPLDQTSILTIDRDYFDNYGKNPIYVLVRDNDRDQDEEFYISENLTPNEAKDYHLLGDSDRNGSASGSGYNSKFDGYMPYCEIETRDDYFFEYYHSFIYTQIIKVYDDTRPVVTGVRDTFCTSPTACTANITKVVTLKDNCTDKVELETQFLMIAPFQTLEAGKMILYSTPRWSTKALADGQFEISVSNLPEGTHDLIVVGRDECGNLSLPTRIPFVVKDCKAPAPICINGLSVDLMPDGNGGGMMTVWATDFVASKIYDCNGQGPETKDGLKLITKYSVNRVQQPVDPNQTSISVNCADLELGFILVELHAWDAVGNHDFCVTYIEVQDNRKVCPTPADKVKIAGTIATEGAGNLQGVSVTLSGSGTQSDMTGTDGNYEFVNITKGGDFTVTPQLDKNHLNGVSTFDLVLIQKHILGVQALNSPYKMIAADANNSKTISTLDLIQIRKLILNIDQNFQNNTSWRFVDATYRFPNPTNPWSASFPEVVSVNDLVTNVRANFVAIKVGDVNASASVNGATSAEIRTSEDFKLKTQEQNLKSGNEYKVTFNAEDLKNIQGYQFALNLDQSKVELLDIEYGVAKAENFGVFKNEGLITTSWNSKYEPGALFTLVLRAKADAKLSQSINLNRLVHPEAYDQNNEDLGIALNFEGIQATEAYELKQNTPNPFNAETVIGFTLPKATKGTLTVRDVKGALVYKVEGNYAKGNNQITLKKEHLGASGVLYYTLETTDFTATKKMVILE